MSAGAWVEAGMVRRYVPVEWCDTCGMSMPADHETFRHSDNPHLYPVRARTAPAALTAEAVLSATDCEGVDAMDHSVSLGAPAPDTRRGHQLSACIALEHLLAHDLPEMITWRIGLAGIFGQLSVHNLSVEQRRELMQQWAEFLGAPVADDPGVGNQFPALRVVAMYRHVGVEIWCPAHPATVRRAS